MIVTYSQEAPLREAVEKTFDGRHPCSLCQQIADGKQSEKKAEYKSEVKKLEFPFVPFAFIFRAPSFFWQVRLPDGAGDVLSNAPPVPPSKALLA